MKIIGTFARLEKRRQVLHVQVLCNLGYVTWSLTLAVLPSAVAKSKLRHYKELQK